MAQKKSGAIELIIVLAVSAGLVFTMVFGFGTYFSGWHLVDDHMSFGFYAKMKYQGYSLWKLLKEMFIDDYANQCRDRFLFHPHRVIQTYFFGLNPKPYFIVKAIESVLALTAMYYAGKELNLKRAGAAAFSLAYYCGPQSAVWWKHGTPQIEASLFLSLGFWMMVKYLKSDNKKYGFLSVLFFFLMTNHHESFIVMLPFIMLFAVYYTWRQMGENVKFSFAVLLDAIKKRLAFEIALGVIFLFHMVYIICFLGVNNYGSVDTHYPLSEALNNYVMSLRGDLKYYWYIGVLLLFILATFYDELKYAWAEILMLAAIIVPQLALYAKEGFYERYLLPLTFGWSLLFVAKAYGDGVLREKKRRIAYTVFLWAMIALSIRKVAIEADYFRFRGQGTTVMLEEMVELQSQGYNVVTTLGTANPEADMTTSKLMAAHNLPECLYWDTNEVLEHPSFYYWSTGEAQVHLEIGIEDADMIVEYNRDDRHFTIDQDNIDHSKFNYVRCGTLDLYFSDRVYNTFTEQDLERFKIKPTIYGLGEE